MSVNIRQILGECTLIRDRMIGVMILSRQDKLRVDRRILGISFNSSETIKTHSRIKPTTK